MAAMMRPRPGDLATSSVQPLPPLLPSPENAEVHGMSVDSIDSEEAEKAGDTEDDPALLLNAWLGELNTLKQGLDEIPQQQPQQNSSPPLQNLKSLPPAVKRRISNNNPQMVANRRSLINLEETVQNDEEWDAILGELSVLESQFEEEIVKSPSASPLKEQPPSGFPQPKTKGILKRPANLPNNAKPQLAATTSANGRTDSPDNDSAYSASGGDNLSMLSSCSASSSSRCTDQSSSKSSSGVSSTASPMTEAAAALLPSSVLQNEEEARIKAEKIKLAIEKIKEAKIKKLFVKFFTADGSAKSILIDERMSAAFVTRMLCEKNRVGLDRKWALVELVPELYMERVYEDHENVVENCMLWKVDSKNTIWFIERPEKYDLFVRPEIYLLGTSSSQRGEHLDEHSRQGLLEEYFTKSTGVGAPELEGMLWLRSEGRKSWKKYFFVLRSSGLYYSPKGIKKTKDLVCLATFEVNQVYYGSGWKKKYKAPSDYCFAIKHPQIQVKNPKYIRYLCVDSERELHQWVTGIRVAKSGRNLYDNFRAFEEEVTHNDIDILTSKRLSVNSPPSTSSSSQQQEQKQQQPVSNSNSKSTNSSCSSENITPVNTIQRRSGDETQRSTVEREGGFASEHTAGGTIKKRPQQQPIVQNPPVVRLPLTSTTRGLIDDQEMTLLNEDEELDSLQIGGGGTLLLRRNKPAENGTLKRKPQVQKEAIDQLSADFESGLESFGMNESMCLPPPPRDETLDRLNLEQVNANPLSEDEDDLPPPPPELCEPEVNRDSGLIVQKSAHPALPPTLPRTSSAEKKISFNENVQLIEVEETGKKAHFKFAGLKRPVLPKPKRLYTPDYNDSVSTAAPPVAFLNDLQRVMNKKWQVAEKCQVNREMTPHQILGFRDPTASQDFNNDAVGAWVRQTQMYNGQQDQHQVLQQQQHAEPLYAVARQQQQQPPQQLIPENSIYSKAAVRYHQVQQQQQQRPPVILREPTPESSQNYQHQPPQPNGGPIYGDVSNYSTVQTPQPNGGIYGTVQAPQPNCGIYGDVSNYSTIGFSRTSPSPNGRAGHHLRSSPSPSATSANNRAGSSSLQGSVRSGSHSPALSGRLPPPPPPRRNENTQLTSNNIYN